MRDDHRHLSLSRYRPTSVKRLECADNYATPCAVNFPCADRLFQQVFGVLAVG